MSGPSIQWQIVKHDYLSVGAIGRWWNPAWPYGVPMARLMLFDLAARAHLAQSHEAVSARDCDSTSLPHGRSPAESPLVSVVVPVFNEPSTLAEVVHRIRRLPFALEIIVVDDASCQTTKQVIEGLPSCVRVFHHSENAGKGAALRTAFGHVRGAIVVIQDADLEYNPADIEHLVAPIISNAADVVYGNRFAVGRRASDKLVHRTANYVLTRLSNWCTGLHLRDMETCYKAMRRQVVDSISIRENRFGVEPELTAKIARGGWRVVEVPVSYKARDYSAGKKIRWRDGVRALWCILRYSHYE